MDTVLIPSDSRPPGSRPGRRNGPAINWPRRPPSSSTSAATTPPPSTTSWPPWTSRPGRSSATSRPKRTWLSPWARPAWARSSTPWPPGRPARPCSRRYSGPSRTRSPLSWEDTARVRSFLALSTRRRCSEPVGWSESDRNRSLLAAVIAARTDGDPSGTRNLLIAGAIILAMTPPCRSGPTRTTRTRSPSSSTGPWPSWPHPCSPLSSTRRAAHPGEAAWRSQPDPTVWRYVTPPQAQLRTPIADRPPRRPRPPAVDGARRHVVHGAADQPRPDRPERRPAHPGEGPPSLEQRAPVDRRRLHPDQRGAAALRRRTRRPLRAAAHLPGRRGHLRWRLAGLCHGPLHRAAHRRPGRDGPGRCLPHARHSVHHRLDVHRSGAGPGHRHLGRCGRHRNGGRPAARRLAPPALLVGLGLLDQRARRHSGLHRRDLLHRREQGPGQALARPGGRGPVLGRADRSDLRPDRGPDQALGLDHRH